MRRVDSTAGSSPFVEQPAEMAVIEPSLPVDFKQIRTMFDDFRKEVDEDFQSPGISHFQDLMPKVKRNVLSLEQVWCTKVESTCTRNVLLVVPESSFR